jgi:glutamate racemase
MVVLMKIGIFDSGMGGTTVFNAIKKLLPNEEYFYIADSKNCPYGEKNDEELWQIVNGNVQKLIEWGAKIIVVACNTATVRCIKALREKYPEIKFVGTEPAIRLAAKMDAKKILVLATPATVSSERAAELRDKYQKPDQEIRFFGCPGLADSIEHTLRFSNYQALPLSDSETKEIKKVLNGLLLGIEYEPDVVVLGCTHYPLIKNEIQSYFKNAELIDGSDGVAKHVAKLAIN